MPSVIVTNSDHGDLAVATIRSVLDQVDVGEVRVVLIDDGSTDGGPALVRRTFGEQVTVVGKARPCGWLDSLSRALDAVEDEVVVVLDADCQAFPHWLRTMLDRFAADPALDIITGPLLHEASFAGKFTAVTSHAAFLGYETGPVPYLVDDNVAFRREALAALLKGAPRGEHISDAVGCAWLNVRIVNRHMNVRLDPELGVKHVVRGLRWQFRTQLKRSPGLSLRMRQVVPSVRGAWARSRLVAPLVFPAARLVRDMRNMWRLRRLLGIRPWEWPLLIAADGVSQAGYAIGLLFSNAYTPPTRETSCSPEA